MDTCNITDMIQKNIPVSFSKYGDGEFLCAFNRHGHNCDKDTYTDKLGNSLRHSFQYMVDYAENAYIGLWKDSQHKHIWENLVKKTVKWADYHTIIYDQKNNKEKLELYKAIKNSKRKKIIICNPLLVKSQMLLNIDHIVNVPFNNWFDLYFDQVLQHVCNLIGDNQEPLVITCCGMSAKVLICELYKKYPKGIFLDFGSALDLICTKKNSRGWGYSYEDVCDVFKDILPVDWEDKKYDVIYNEAKNRLGIHL